MLDFCQDTAGWEGCHAPHVLYQHEQHTVLAVQSQTCTVAQSYKCKQDATEVFKRIANVLAGSQEMPVTDPC